MAERVNCPECQAHLALPALAAEQTAQCPRCRHVFAPMRHALAAARSAVKPAYDDEPMPDELPILEPRPLAGVLLAKVAMVLLALSTLAYGVELYVRYEHSQLLEEGPDPRMQRIGLRGRVLGVAQIALQKRLENWEGHLMHAKILHHATFWPAMIVFLCWLDRACKNARNLGAQGMSFLPATAVLSFFMPILNLFWPCMALQDLWRASDPELVRTPQGWKNASGSPLIPAWWLCFLVATGLYLFVRLILFNRFDQGDDHFGERLMCLSRGTVLVEGVLLILIIRGIMQRQTARFERLQEAALEQEAQE